MQQNPNPMKHLADVEHRSEHGVDAGRGGGVDHHMEP